MQAQAQARAWPCTQHRAPEPPVPAEHLDHGHVVRGARWHRVAAVVEGLQELGAPAGACVQACVQACVGCVRVCLGLACGCMLTTGLMLQRHTVADTHTHTHTHAHTHTHTTHTHTTHHTHTHCT
jgi:hypothetical protein